MIPYGRQDINQADIDAVVALLRSDFLTQGPAVQLFELAVSSYCGAKHAVAVSSATAALHLACLALDLGPGDYLWTSPVTFVASANCALYCGAKVDFVDIDPRTYNMSVERLAEKLAQADKCGKLPKIVVPVHLCGQSCDMDAIHALSQQYGFKIIEDASHAIGGKYKNETIGNCRYSDITVFSFHPVKIITTGEGGVALTNNAELSNRIALLRSHGITRDPAQMTHETEGAWYYQQIMLGYNYRMTDIQAALGASQMLRLDEFVEKRNGIAQQYDERLVSLAIVLPWQHQDSRSSLHLYPIRLKLKELKMTHREVFNALRAKEIGVNLHYIPVHMQPYYQALGFKRGDFPIAEQYYEEAISLPIYSSLSQDNLEIVIAAINTVLQV